MKLITGFRVRTPNVTQYLSWHNQSDLWAGEKPLSVSQSIFRIILPLANENITKQCQINAAMNFVPHREKL